MSTPVTLLLDIGNSRIKAAAAGEAANGVEFIDAAAHADQDIQQWLSGLHGTRPFADVAYACVAHESIAESVEQWASANQLPAFRARTTASALGVTCAYPDPSRLGVDRWLVVLAAAAAQQDSLIVNAGTACTIDVVAANGQHRGGLILPGIGLGRAALNQRTQFYAETQELLADGLPLLGDDTIPAVNLGCLHAVAGAVQRVQRELDWPDKHGRLLLSGGEAPLLRPILSSAWDVRPNLVLEGLARLAFAEKNR